MPPPVRSSFTCVVFLWPWCSPLILFRDNQRSGAGDRFELRPATVHENRRRRCSDPRNRFGRRSDTEARRFRRDDHLERKYKIRREQKDQVICLDILYPAPFLADGLRVCFLLCNLAWCEKSSRVVFWYLSLWRWDNVGCGSIELSVVHPRLSISPIDLRSHVDIDHILRRDEISFRLFGRISGLSCGRFDRSTK